MLDLHPRQNQKATVVGEKTDIAAPGFGRPAKEAIAAAQVTGRRTPRQAGDRTPLPPHHVLQVFAYGLLVAKVMMVLDQTVEERFIARAPDLLKVQGPKLAQRLLEGRGVNQDRGGPHAPDEWIGGSETNPGQLNRPRPAEHQQQAPADHVAQRPVGLLPLPSLAQFPGQRPSAGLRVFGDEPLDEGDLFGAKGLSINKCYN